MTVLLARDWSQHSTWLLSSSVQPLGVETYGKVNNNESIVTEAVTVCMETASLEYNAFSHKVCTHVHALR